jgi:membrane protease YdiL (CAAX protease family)
VPSFRSAAPDSRTPGRPSLAPADQAKRFPATVLRLAGLPAGRRGTPVAFSRSVTTPPSPATLAPGPVRPAPGAAALRALALYGLFLGAAFTALRWAAADEAGRIVGPLAAQAAMGLVIFVGARLVLAGQTEAPRLVAARRLGTVPLVLIGIGGFLAQVSALSGARLLSAAAPAGAPAGIAPEAWPFVFATSVVGAPILEEIFFRGLLQPVLSRRSALVGVVATAALFGLAHGLETPFRAVPAFGQGLVLGGVVLLTGRLRSAVIVHAVNNALVLAAGLLVALRPPAVVSEISPAFLAVSAAAAAALLAWGFARIVRAPRAGRVAAAPA